MNYFFFILNLINWNKNTEFNKNKINALQIINEIYNENNLKNKNRNYILEYCSTIAIKKMEKINPYKD